MSNSVVKTKINGVVIHNLGCKIDSNGLGCAPMIDKYQEKVTNYGGNEKMDKTIVSKWRNRKGEKLRKELEENREILRRDDKAYKEIIAAINKWKDELSGNESYADIISNSKYCISAETQEKIATIEKEYRDRFDALDRKAEMVNAAIEFVSDYDSMKKVLEDFGIWSEIIEG